MTKEKLIEIIKNSELVENFDDRNAYEELATLILTEMQKEREQDRRSVKELGELKKFFKEEIK